MTLTLDRAAVAVDEMVAFARARLIKAAGSDVKRKQQALIDDVSGGFTAAMADYFAAFAGRALPVAKATAFGFDPDDIDWDIEEAELTDILGTWYREVGQAAYKIVGGQIGVEIDWDLNARGVKRVMGKIGTRVKDITDTSRQALRNMVEAAINRGDSVDELARGLRLLTDRWAGVDRATYLEMLKDADLPGWEREMLQAAIDASNSRAQTIALTETATAYSLSSTAAYRDSGLIDNVEVLDGPECGWTEHDDPDLADGSIRTLDEADEYPTAHPNCQRAFSPRAAR